MEEFDQNRQAIQVLHTQTVILEEIKEQNEMEESVKLSVV